MADPPRCPDCGGHSEDHNAVNHAGNGFMAHSGHMGACWKSLNTPFVELLRDYLLGLKGTTQARHSHERRGGHDLSGVNSVQQLGQGVQGGLGFLDAVELCRQLLGFDQQTNRHGVLGHHGTGFRRCDGGGFLRLLLGLQG